MDAILSSLPANFDILSIPGFWVLALAPHAYAIHVASGGKPANWDNRGPRTTAFRVALEKKLPPAILSKYQRCESASANAFENLPIFVAAIILGRMANLPADEMNRFAVKWLLGRAAHTIAYITISNKNLTPLRTMAYFYTVSLAMGLFVKVAKAMP